MDHIVELLQNIAAIVRLVPAALVWLSFFLLPQNGLLSILAIIYFCLYVLIATILIIGRQQLAVAPSRLMYDLVTYLVIFIGCFATIYWNYGFKPNFNTTLTRLDAVYFMIGTLGTAGTGDIAATSELIRAVQCLQMILDLGFVVFAVAIVVAAFGTPRNSLGLSPCAPSLARRQARQTGSG